MVGVIASLMDSPPRWELFCHLLQSIKEQTHPLEELVIGMSFLNREEAHKYLSLWKSVSKPAYITLVTSTTALTQGEMWKKILDKQSERLADGWLVFSDDDDLWHPRRVELYKFNLKMASSAGVLPKISGIHAPYVHDDAPFGKLATKASDVDEMLREGALSLQSFQCSTQNYTDTCCRASVFAEILQASTSAFRKHPYFDTILQRAVCQYKPAEFQSVAIRPEMLASVGCHNVWMYYWRNSAESMTTRLQRKTSDPRDFYHLVCARPDLYRDALERCTPCQALALRAIGKAFKRGVGNFENYVDFSYL